MNIRTPANFGKLATFVVISVAMALFLVSLLGNGIDVRGTTATYHAVFANASYLKAGDEVRVAGVAVGSVDAVTLRSDDTVLVTFNATMVGGLPSAVNAAIHYKDLLGDRYLELMHGTGVSGVLAPGGTIPIAHTTPAVDLDTLTGGFKPLFQALNPQQVNMLSTELIAVFQGESGSVATLLKSVASLTSTLANSSQVIGNLIANLSQVLGTLDKRNGQLDTSVVQLQQLITGLQRDGAPIAHAVYDIDTMARQSSSLIRSIRAPLRIDVSDVSRVARALNRSSAKVNAALSGLSKALHMIAGIGVYGDFFNFFICDIQVRFDGPNGHPIYTPWVESKQPNCSGRPVGQ